MLIFNFRQWRHTLNLSWSERQLTSRNCISSSDSDIDSTIIRNSEGDQNIETDQWDFEETIGDKISDGNAFGGIVERNRFEPCASDSGLILHSIDSL